MQREYAVSLINGVWTVQIVYGDVILCVMECDSREQAESIAQAHSLQSELYVIIRGNGSVLDVVATTDTLAAARNYIDSREAWNHVSVICSI